MGKMCEVCSKLTMKTSEQRQWRCSGVFILNFKYILHIIPLMEKWDFKGHCNYSNPTKTIHVKISLCTKGKFCAFFVCCFLKWLKKPLNLYIESSNSSLGQCFFPIQFDSSGKPKVCQCFQGERKGNVGLKRVNHAACKTLTAYKSLTY